MNEKDEAIVRIIGRRSGFSSRALSKMLGIPISTVHRRIKKLEQDGLVKGYRALIDYEKTSWPIGALLMIDLAEVVSGKGLVSKKDVLSVLTQFDEVEEVIEVQAANFDLVIRARFPSLRKLAEFIERLRRVEGIEETSTAIITDETVLPPPIL